MGAPINVGFDLANSATSVIPLNRWTRGNYSVQLETGTSILVEGTLTQLNRPDRVTGVAPIPVWDTLDDSEGNPLTAATAITNIDFVPLTAIRITATGTCVGRLMQQGEVS